MQGARCDPTGKEGSCEGTPPPLAEGLQQALGPPVYPPFSGGDRTAPLIYFPFEVSLPTLLPSVL